MATTRLRHRRQVAGSGGASRLTGQKMFVCADGLMAFWSTPAGPTGRLLCFVAHGAPGCSLSEMPTVDGRKLAALSLAENAGRSHFAASVVAECGGYSL